MVGIYSDDFIEFLKSALVDVKITGRNIICRCPWCEMESRKSHFHLYISVDQPIFHCFNKDCTKKKGTISKLVQKLSGKDISEDFFDKSLIKTKFEKVKNVNKELIFPPLDIERFDLKYNYLNDRIFFNDINILKLPGVVFDIMEFVKINNIKLDESTIKVLPYLQDQFIGFVSDNGGLIVCRNIDKNNKFRYYKFSINNLLMADYYRLSGNSSSSNTVVLGEGVFDILSESIFNYTNLKENTKLYAACLSTSYESLIKSIVYYEQLFKLDVHILSDDNIKLFFYEKLKQNLTHIIDTMTIYYNKTGKDFGSSPVIVERFVIGNRSKKYYVSRKRTC